MTKFVVVKEAPKQLEKSEYVVSVPNFVEEIRLNKGKAPRSPLTAPNHLRAIAGSIGQKYAPDEFNVLTHVKPHNFEGRLYESEEGLSGIVVEMLEAGYPQIFEKAIDHQIKNRPFGTKLIYFVGNFKQTTSFTRNGIDQLKIDEVDTYMGRKEKEKKADKPAKTVASTENTVV